MEIITPLRRPYYSTGWIQFVVLTTLPLLFKGFLYKNPKSETTIQLENYLEDL